MMWTAIGSSTLVHRGHGRSHFFILSADWRMSLFKDFVDRMKSSETSSRPSSACGLWPFRCGPLDYVLRTTQGPPSSHAELVLAGRPSTPLAGVSRGGWQVWGIGLQLLLGAEREPIDVLARLGHNQAKDCVTLAG